MNEALVCPLLKLPGTRDMLDAKMKDTQNNNKPLLDFFEVPQDPDLENSVSAVDYFRCPKVVAGLSPKTHI
jgi:hypothetical protein